MLNVKKVNPLAVMKDSLPFLKERGVLESLHCIFHLQKFNMGQHKTIHGSTNIAGWNVFMFNRKYIFFQGPFSSDLGYLKTEAFSYIHIFGHLWQPSGFICTKMTDHWKIQSCFLEMILFCPIVFRDLISEQRQILPNPKPSQNHRKFKVYASLKLTVQPWR